MVVKINTHPYSTVTTNSIKLDNSLLLDNATLAGFIKLARLLTDNLRFYEFYFNQWIYNQNKLSYNK